MLYACAYNGINLLKPYLYFDLPGYSGFFQLLQLNWNSTAPHQRLEFESGSGLNFQAFLLVITARIIYTEIILICSLEFQ